MKSDAAPRWAPRVRRSKIRRLYETDALGIYDDELIDDVGYALLARCRSFLAASNFSTPLRSWSTTEFFRFIIFLKSNRNPSHVIPKSAASSMVLVISQA